MSTSPARCCHSGLVRLATLNVFGLSGNWSDRLVVLRNGFLALDADLITLQETMVREEVDQAAEILGPAQAIDDAIGRYATWRFHEGGVFDYPIIDERLVKV